MIGVTRQVHGVDERRKALNTNGMVQRSGTEIDALLEGIACGGGYLGHFTPNKRFGKGLRGTKRQELERELLEVIATASDSRIAAELKSRATNLNLCGSGDLDVSAFANWPALRRLEVRNATRITGLTTLTHLRDLHLTADELDLESLTTPEDLAWLVLDAKAYRGVLEAHCKTVSLRIHGPKVPQVRGCTSLIILPAADMTDLGTLAVEVERLNISGVERASIVPTPRLKSLAWRCAAKASSLSGLRECTSLRAVSIDSVESTEWLRGVALEELDVQGATHDLAAIAGMATLRRLSLTGSAPIEAFGSLDSLPPLEHLTVRQAPWADFVWGGWKRLLRHTPHLRSLEIRNHDLEDVLELPELPLLEELDLSYCGGAMDIACVSRRFPKLRRLVLTGTGLRKRDLPTLGAAIHVEF